MQPFRFWISRWTEPPRKSTATIDFPSLDFFKDFVDGRVGESKTEYRHTQIEEGIEAFLTGCHPDDEVSISYNSRL
jgi:hypothetical protein